ncbi:LPXTG cell wall anchor domain-containing protein [Sulfurimonas sp.]
MIKFLLLVLLPFSLYASRILSYNIYERTNRADVMITFDTPYTGQIKQSVRKSKIIIKLEDATIESSKIKKVSSRYLHSLTITPINNETIIVASISPATKLIVSKTSDAYGLRLRFTDKTTLKAPKASVTAAAATNSLSSLPTKKEEDISQSYYVVIGILLLGIFILLYIKKKMKPIAEKEQKQTQNSWLFKNTKEATRVENDNIAQNVSIRFQKAIDNNNSVVMLDFGAQSYLVLMGNSNILLDKFTDNKPSSQQEFDEILQSRHEDLENFLGNSQNKEKQEPLQAYKERAANIAYEM